MKPMLSGTCTDINTLRYPVLVSPKLDGIRALVIDGVLVSRNLKPIRNSELQSRYGSKEFEGLDGELITGPPTAPDCFLVTTSTVMSADKPAGNTRFMVFDRLPSAPGLTFNQRRAGLNMSGVTLVPHLIANNADELSIIEVRYLAQGYEGLMIRDPQGPYKQGRSTEKEGWLLKLKRFEDAEATVVSVEELMHNANEATVDALGHTKRSTHAANMKGRGALGALKVLGLNGPYAGSEFSIGTGMNDVQRAELWRAREGLPGLTVKYRYFPLGSKDAPRFPVFLGFREDL